MICILILLLLFVLLMCNMTFVTLTSPMVFLLYRIKRRRKVVEVGREMNIMREGYSSFRLLKRYLDGFIRYYDYRVSQVPSHHFRSFVYRYIYCMDLAPKVVVYYGAEMREPYKIKIGRGSIIGDRAILDGRNGLEIGENVNFSSNVSIWTEQHDHVMHFSDVIHRRKLLLK